MIYAIVLFGLDIVVGYTGQVSLGHAGLFGIGAYTAGVMVLKLGASLWLTLPAAIALTAAFGALLVFASAVMYALYLLYSGELVKRLGSMRLVGLASSVACLCCITQFLVLRPLGSFEVAPPVIWLSVLNATLCTAAPVLMVMMAIERVGAGAAAQAGMVGPLSTILLGVLLLGEPFTAWVAAGTVLVIAGIYVFTRSKPA